jgi:predicted NAD/FAD-dependent oxidoreductase
MSFNPPVVDYDLAIIGSGIAGLAAARAATAKGLSVKIFDKGRRIGGRAATRRANGFTFTHGAQFLTARADEFQDVCAAAVVDGALTNWQIGGKAAFIGQPTMRDFAVFLGRDLDISQSVEITSIGAADNHLNFHTAEGVVASANRAILTPPAPQTAALLHQIAPTLATIADGASYAPCWTAMFGFDEAPPLPMSSEPLQFDEGPIALANYEAHRPGSDRANFALTIQASGEWSAQHLEDASEQTGRTLLAELSSLLGVKMPTPIYEGCHRWRYAKVIEPATPTSKLTSECGRIAIAGDWVIGPRIEAAFLSGLKAFEQLSEAAELD